METHTLDLPDVALVYDTRGSLPDSDGRRALLMIGQPMTAEGYTSLAPLIDDRAVITYDPRGLGRSRRRDGLVTNDPVVQAEDLHALIEHLGVGPVDVFGSSGGAVTGLALVAAHPRDVHTLVAHEPPIVSLLPDVQEAIRARAAVTDAYDAGGSGAGFAAFMAMTSWTGEYTDAYFAQPPADPAAFGMSSDDDGRRDDPLLSDRSWPVTDYEIDLDAVNRSAAQVIIAVGESTGDACTGRTSRAVAQALGQQAVVFPGGHGDWLGAPYGQDDLTAPFAARLREVLAD